MVKTLCGSFARWVCDHSADYKPLCALVCASSTLLSVNVFPHVAAVKLREEHKQRYVAAASKPKILWQSERVSGLGRNIWLGERLAEIARFHVSSTSCG